MVLCVHLSRAANDGAPFRHRLAERCKRNHSRFLLPALERTTWRTETESFLGHGKTGRKVADCLLLADLFFFELKREKKKTNTTKRTTTEGNSSGNENGRLGTLQKLRLLLCHCYRSMSWSTSSKDLAMLGRLDSELPLLFLECPPESVRDRNSVLNRTHTRQFQMFKSKQEKKKSKQNIKLAQALLITCITIATTFPLLALPPSPSPPNLAC